MTQYDAKYFFKFLFKEMIITDLFNVRNVKYIARFFWSTVYVSVFDCYLNMFAYCPFKNKHCVPLHSTVAVVKPNFKLSIFNFCLKRKRMANCFINIYKLNTLSAKSSSVDERLKIIIIIIII